MAKLEAFFPVATGRSSERSDGENQMDIETIWYEYTPYLYVVVGIMSVLHIGSLIGTCFGLLLVAAAGLIIFKRHNYRKLHSDKKEHGIANFR